VTSRRFATFLAERERDSEGRDQFVDLRLELRIATVLQPRTPRAAWSTEGEETVLAVGGRWDRVKRRWIEGAHCQAHVIRITRGGAQEKAARWLARWFRAHATGDWESAGMTRWDEETQGRVRSVWSALMSGGRRSGKSHLCLAALALFAVFLPEAVCWGVSPTQDETAELEKALRRMLPTAWYKYRGAGAGKVSTFTLPHGSEILLLSGYKPRGLRRGRVDLALFNEGQNMSRGGYVQLRPATADMGGLVLIAANPPEDPIGQWVEEHAEGIGKGSIDGVHFEFDPEENPWVDPQALRSMRAEVDEVTYDRDVRGIFRPIGKVVFHAYSDRETKKPVPVDLVDITEDVTCRHFGRRLPWVLGMDFQFPIMVAAALKFFQRPGEPDDVLAWVLGEIMVPNATEDELVTAIENADVWTPGGYLAGAGFDPEQCAVVMDASGFFQDAKRNKGKTSELWLRARRWRWLYKPDKDADRNPDVLERIKVTNARLKTADQKRHMFVEPRCEQIARALKLWELRNGRPYTRSIYAHPGDATSYVLFRIFGRPKVNRPPPGYTRVRPSARVDEMRGL
jgi:hypothetical protein